MSTVDSSIKKAVILAGGLGTRLYPVTLEIPKPLLPVQGRPIISYLIDLFLKHGVSEIILALNNDKVKHFERWKREHYPNVNILLSEETTNLGTFGAIYAARHSIGNYPFFVTNGDELKSFRLNGMSSFHKKENSIATIAVLEVDNPCDYGVVEFDADGRIRQFIEKPKEPVSRYINSGLYLFEPGVFDYFPYKETRFAMVETDLFPQLAKAGKLRAYPVVGQWFDCGTFQRWEKAIREWNPQKET
jgi:NDP-sugar pyrophosphorylase family protein